MGTWGFKTFENDAAADWLYDLEEARGGDFLLRPLQAVARAERSADLDDCLEGLAAAEILAGARYEPPRGLPRIARSWVKRTGFVPRDSDLKIALRAVKRIGEHSELADTWKESGRLAAWTVEVQKLSGRLAAALRAKPPVRQTKPKVQREKLAELIIAVATDKS